jgi:hypothetical protein
MFQISLDAAQKILCFGKPRQSEDQLFTDVDSQVLNV